MGAEIAMSFILLVGAGLLIKSFRHLREVKPGFNTNNLLVMRVSVPPGKFKEDAQRLQFFEQAGDHIRSLPGVQSVGMIPRLPLGGDTVNVWRGLCRGGRP